MTGYEELDEYGSLGRRRRLTGRSGIPIRCRRIGRPTAKATGLGRAVGLDLGRCRALGICAVPLWALGAHSRAAGGGSPGASWRSRFTRRRLWPLSALPASASRWRALPGPPSAGFRSRRTKSTVPSYSRNPTYIRNINVTNVSQYQDHQHHQRHVNQRHRRPPRSSQPEFREPCGGDRRAGSSLYRLGEGRPGGTPRDAAGAAAGSGQRPPARSDADRRAASRQRTRPPPRQRRRRQKLRARKRRQRRPRQHRQKLQVQARRQHRLSQAPAKAPGENAPAASTSQRSQKAPACEPGTGRSTKPAASEAAGRRAPEVPPPAVPHPGAHRSRRRAR